MDEKEYQEKLRKILKVEEAFCAVFKNLSEAFSKCNTDAPKKIIRNYLAHTILAIHGIGELLDLDLEEGVNFICNEIDRRDGKEKKND